MRKDWDQYFMDICHVVKTRATCPRRSIGEVLVRNKRIIATAYNGAPPGMLHCTEVGCFMVDNHCKRALHAEENIIFQLTPQELKGSTLYLTDTPCLDCSLLIIEADITRVVYDKPYREGDSDGLNELKKAGIEISCLSPYNTD